MAANDLQKRVSALLKERETLKVRNREIARELNMLRVRLSRLPPTGDITPQGNTIAPPSDAIDDFLEDY